MLSIIHAAALPSDTHHTRNQTEHNQKYLHNHSTRLYKGLPSFPVMFTTSITIVESDLHIKTPIKNNGNNGGTSNKTKAMISASPVAKGTTNHDEVTNDTKVAGHSRPFAAPTFWFLSSPIAWSLAFTPKPEPVPELTTPEPVDGAVGPKPEPVPRPPTPDPYPPPAPIFWRLLWLQMLAPVNPAI
ncbi:hypothetical protein D6C90_09959 [Aureobasidium pullulans]|uniref:Uncharacterized protein n=2 Tax=Aureobasidium pullulans TaxID=5580 RepID=A0A4V4KIX6_AURPU|nr:hypothetical protein D6C90_09959 [Aureobasidium pullulans]